MWSKYSSSSVISNRLTGCPAIPLAPGGPEGPWTPWKEYKDEAQKNTDIHAFIKTREHTQENHCLPHPALLSCSPQKSTDLKDSPFLASITYRESLRTGFTGLPELSLQHTGQNRRIKKKTWLQSHQDGVHIRASSYFSVETLRNKNNLKTF